ncbi:MAG: hypothetical protein ABIJ96_17160 [Elusimicrobiota bacterium]
MIERALWTSISVGFVFGLCLTPVAGGIARAWGVVAKPRPDRWSGRPVPMLGGLAIYAALLLGCLASSAVSHNVAGILMGGGLLLVIGALDDRYGFKPQTKLIGQILGACLLAAMGIGFKLRPAEFISIAASIFWIVAIINAINLMDNMDGLAPGVSLIAAAFLSIQLALGGNLPEACLALALTGALTAFMFFNFPPARIFMGDAGSMSVGIILAGLSLSTGLFSGQKLGAISVLVGPALVLAVPLFDVFLVTITRTMRGKSISEGGKDHSSHRLVLLGLSERKTLLILYLLAGMAGLAGLQVGTSTSFGVSLILVPLLWIVLGLFFAYLARIQIKEGKKQVKGKVSVIVGWVFKRRMIEVLMDLGLSFICFCLAYFIRFDFAPWPIYRTQVIHMLPWVMALTIGALHLAGIYRGVWEHYGIRDIYRFAGAMALAVMACVWVAVLVYRFDMYPRSVFPLYGILMFLAILAVRTSFHFFDMMLAAAPQGQGVVIVGTDAAARMVYSDIGSSDKKWKVVAFLDDNPDRHGTAVFGVPVVDVKGLPGLDRRNPFARIVVTETEISPETSRVLSDYARDSAKHLQRFRISYEDWVSRES